MEDLPLEALRSAPNHLLARLPRKDRERFMEGCAQVELGFNEALAQPGEPLGHLHFPTGGFISLMTRMPEGSRIEVALVGTEGMHGMPLFLGVGIAQEHAIVQGAGSALRMSAARFAREVKASPALRAILNNYVFVTLSQLAQTAGCNRFHVVEERLARWLLMTADRSHSEAFRITHEYLAMMLGVRRAGVTKAASALQRAKLIRYSRGSVEIIDRHGLERASCGCYRADLEIYKRVFS